MPWEGTLALIIFETYLEEVLNLVETQCLGIHRMFLLDLVLAAQHYIYINIYTFVVEDLGVLKTKIFASHGVVLFWCVNFSVVCVYVGVHMVRFVLYSFSKWGNAFKIYSTLF